MYKVITSIVIMAAFATGGCKSSGLLAKREAEKCCPTDIRKTVPWCAGEDALFKCPCEPSAAFYGYKPTCWRTWPANGAAWRDMHCGDQHHGAVISELTQQNPELIELPSPKPLSPTPAPVESSVLQPTEIPIEAKSEIQDSTVEIELEPAPEPPSVPTLREVPRTKPSMQPKPETELNNATDSGRTKSNLPLPEFGPIPLPPIDQEYPE